MGLGLHSAPRDFVALLIARHMDTGAIVRRFVTCTGELYLKGAQGKLYRDEEGEYRWITVHPHKDPDEPGTPVKIRPSKTEPGTWHVVAGAGGHLNYLRLTGVKSPEEYRQKAAEKRTAAKERERAESAAKEAARRSMTEEERAAEVAAERGRAAAREAQEAELRTKRQEFVKRTAEQLGWKAEEWQFAAMRERLTKAGADAKRIDKLEAAHHARVYQRALDALEASKRQLLADRDEALTAIPLTSPDGTTAALDDFLEPPQTPTGKGFRSATQAESERALRAAAATADVQALTKDLETATKQLEDEDAGPEAIARVTDLRSQLEIADLVRQSATTTPEQIASQRAVVADERQKIVTEQAAYAPRLAELRESGAESAERDTLEKQASADVARLQALQKRVTDLAVLAGEASGGVEGEKTAIRAKTQAQREAEIQAEGGSVERYRANRERLRLAGERYRAEMKRLHDAGALKPPDLPARPVTDAEVVLKLLAEKKALEKASRTLAEAKARDTTAPDKLFGKGYFTERGGVSAEARKAAESELRAAVREQATKAFLEKVESPALLLGRGKEFTEDYDNHALHRALERHLTAGAYNALNEAGLAATKAAVLRRDVVDVLGAAGSAQLLAWVIGQQESPATLKEMATRLGQYHVTEHVERAEEHIREMEAALDAADEAIATLTTPADLSVAMTANQRRRVALEDARKTMGEALGEYEATAALVAALPAGTPTEIATNLGPVGTETAIRQMRAIGLGREDYAITSDGTNYFATVKPSGFPKLATRPDPGLARLTDEVLAIKRGERDEADWKPPGTITRTATSLNGQSIIPHSLTEGMKPYSAFGEKSDVGADVREHIARRAANGEDVDDILVDMHGAIMAVPAAQRKAYAAAITAVFPSTRDGVPVKAEEHEAAVEKLTRDWFKEQELPYASAIHGQGVCINCPEMHEAMFRSIAKDPRAAAAFKAVGDLTTQDQRGLRHYFAQAVAKTDPATGLDPGVTAALAKLGPEPPKEAAGLFGAPEKTAEWLEWARKRDAITASGQFAGDAPKTSSWTEFVSAVGGLPQAYAVLQDRLKSDFLRDFHRHYTTGRNVPLRIGIRDVAHRELYEGFLDPKQRQKNLEKRRELLDAARNRLRGQYAAGSALERLERMEQAEEIVRQNQMGLLGATTAAPARTTPTDGQRYTLGRRVEAQIASMMPNVAQHFVNGHPVKLLADKSYSGKFAVQQRVIKHFLTAKRMVNATGTGSGKTSMMIGAFTAAREDAKRGVKRGLFLVPSSVQGQFDAEFARFVDPKKLHWAANPGGDRAQRLAEHSNADTGAVVHTHQAFRDDMLHLVAQHLGVSEEEAKKRFMGLSRAAAAQEMRDAWKAAGVDYQAIFVDEGHGLLDREGKPDSFLSRVVQAASDTAPYYMSSSADPVKNDVSELRSLLSKLHPDGRYDDEAEWNRRYGVNTSAAAEALKREVAPWIYAAHIRTGNRVDRHQQTVPMSAKQATEYAAVMRAFDALRAARGKGDLAAATAAAKVLAPERFSAGADEAAVAREVMSNGGAFKEQALARVVDAAPRADNAKIQAIVERLKTHPVKDKPVVIFAHRLAAVREISEALAEAGHRVETLTGADSGPERDRKRLRFHPEGDEKPQADVFILSDAGATGLNLQRGQTVIQYDRPMTAMLHAQRNGRIDRLGQQHPQIDLVDLTTDSPYEARAQERIKSKYVLRDILTDPAAGLDDSGMAGVFAAARQAAKQEAVAGPVPEPEPEKLAA